MFTLGTALGAGVAGALVGLSEVADLPLAEAIAAADGLMVIVIGLGLLVVHRLPSGRDAGSRAMRTDAGLASPAGSVAPYKES
jgi:hypothetical protein